MRIRFRVSLGGKWIRRVRLAIQEADGNGEVVTLLDHVTDGEYAG
jgi:hypothetical protein